MLLEMDMSNINVMHQKSLQLLKLVTKSMSYSYSFIRLFCLEMVLIEMMFSKKQVRSD